MARGFLLKNPTILTFAELLLGVGQDRGAGFFVKKSLTILTSAELLSRVGQDRGAGFFVKKTLQF